jgi:hypothetical protein
MKTLHTAFVLALAVTWTASVQAGVLETTKGPRFTTDSTPAYKTSGRSSAQGSCAMMKEVAVTRVYDLHSKGHGKIARVGTENKCETLLQKKADSKEVASKQVCRQQGVAVLCDAMRS